MSGSSDTFRNRCLKEHRHLEEYLALACHVAGKHIIEVDLPALRCLLGVQRAKKVRLDWLAEDISKSFCSEPLDFRRVYWPPHGGTAQEKVETGRRLILAPALRSQTQKGSMDAASACRAVNLHLGRVTPVSDAIAKRLRDR